ncbi:MAG TPA: L-2-amino-thiazoline-4-carboxylic acid hydrolase, partial [Bacillota bacterium]|nr:L-2-amino-thiazoline-4-carboxylic acid hydrolase [Bacillota bacterium]
KYFQAHEANELAPFFCYIDFSLAKAFNRGLTRVKTLSEGDEKCEFRYKKGRTTKADWPPEFLKKELGS